MLFAKFGPFCLGLNVLLILDHRMKGLMQNCSISYNNGDTYAVISLLFETWDPFY